MTTKWEKWQQGKKQGTKDLENRVVNKRAIVNPYLLIIILNVNWLSSPIKRQND